MIGGTSNGMQNSTGYQRIDEGEERLVEPFSIWAKRMISKPLYLFLAAVIIIGGITVCVNHPWNQEHKKMYPIIKHLPYEGHELFEYAEYTFGINASIVLGNSTLHLTIWEIVVPLMVQPFIDCPDEPYNLTSEGATSIITLTNMSVSTDCIYKKLHGSLPSKLKMKLSDKMVYDPFHEQITVHFSILDLIKFDVGTYPTTSSPTALPTKSPTLKPTSAPTKLPTSTPTFKTRPVGVYAGNKTILGTKIDGEMVFVYEGVCDIQILVDAAHLKITCIDEPYIMNGTSVNLTGVHSEGNCVHDQLIANNVTLVSVTFSGQGDDVEVAVKYDHLTEKLALTHKNEGSSYNFAYVVS